MTIKKSLQVSFSGDNHSTNWSHWTSTSSRGRDFFCSAALSFCSDIWARKLFWTLRGPYIRYPKQLVKMHEEHAKRTMHNIVTLHCVFSYSLVCAPIKKLAVFHRFANWNVKIPTCYRTRIFQIGPGLYIELWVGRCFTL